MGGGLELWWKIAFEDSTLVDKMSMLILRLAKNEEHFTGCVSTSSKVITTPGIRNRNKKGKKLAD
jgi:hypothetical protein